jgi:hypothetical protein
MLKKYIDYLKRETKEVQKFHIALISGFFTGLFAFIYISVLYDTTNIPIFKKINSNFTNEVNYKRVSDADEAIMNYENENKIKAGIEKDSFENSSQSPLDVFFDIWTETKSKLSESRTSIANLKEVFSNQSSYETK